MLTKAEFCHKSNMKRMIMSGYLSGKRKKIRDYKSSCYACKKKKADECQLYGTSRKNLLFF